MPIGNLIEECNNYALRTHRRAILQKWLAIIGNFIIIVGSSANGAIQAYRGQALDQAILSFSVAAINSFFVLFTPEKRALALEHISIEFSRLSRKLRYLNTSDPDQSNVKKTLDEAYNRLDELKFRHFGRDASKFFDHSDEIT